MADVLVKPAFVALQADSGDVTKLGPNAWNAARLFTGGSNGDVLERDSVSATGASWVAPSIGAHTHPWADITGTPITLAGYGIPAVTKADVGLGSVEDTALSTWVGSANLTTLGTIATGIWSGTAIAAIKGGTGQTGYAVGDLLYADTTTTLAKRAAVAVGQVLVSAGVNTAPAWSAAPVVTSVKIGTGANLTSPGDGRLVLTNNAIDKRVMFETTLDKKLRLLNFDASLFADLECGPLTVQGVATFNNVATFASNLTAAAAAEINWTGRSVLASPNNGLLNVTVQGAGTGIGLDISTDAVMKLRTRAQTGYATLDCLGLKASGVAGVSFGPAHPASITIVNGIVTACT